MHDDGTRLSRPTDLGSKAPPPAWAQPRDLFALGCLLLLFLLPNLWWALFDRRVWPWDQAWYGEVTTDLYYLLLHRPSDWYSGLISLMPSKPPLLAWLGQLLVPVGEAGGSVDVGLMVFIVLMQAATLGVVWMAARIAAPRNVWAAVAAVLLLASSPLFVGLSHQYLVEPLQTLATAGSLLLALLGPRLSAFRISAFLVLVVVVAIGSKTTGILYCGLFWAMSGWTVLSKVRARQWGWRAPLSWIVLAAAILLGVPTVDWYVTNMADALLHVQAATGADADLYGHRDVLLKKLLFWWHAGESAFFVWQPALGLLFIAFAISLLSRFVRVPNPGLMTVEGAVALAALGHILITTLLLASQPNEETRFLVSLGPNLAYLLAWSLGLPRMSVVAGGFSALLGLQFILVNLQALGAPIHMATSAWLLPINTDRTDRRTAHDLAIDTCPASAQGRINVIGPEFPRMNANSMAFFSAKQRLSDGFRCYYTSLGYAETDLAKALARLDSLHAAFVVFPRADLLPKDPDAFNRVLDSAEAAVSTTDRYQKVDDVGGYDVFKRTEEK